MNQREKVLKGLECCRWSMQNVKPEKWKCDKCPYKDADILNSYTVWQKCVNVLARDAYYLLNGDKLRQLPPAEPEQKLDEWCTDCKEYDQEKYCCHRWNMVIRTTVEEMKQQEHGKWISCSERMPEMPNEVLTTYIVNGNRKNRFVETATYYDGDEGFWSSPWDEYRVAGTRVEVIAWMPLPEPYKASQTETGGRK